MSQNIRPPTINLETVSDEFRANYVANHAQQAQVNVVLTNSFGFGGTNSTLCFSKPK
jgi:3-oxoacyl-[acyl-carrier-protein] synthase II